MNTISDDNGQADEDGSWECPECGKEFDSQRGLHVHEGQVHPDRRVEDLEKLLDSFTSDAKKAVDIKREREKLAYRLKQLSDEKEDLEETVHDLRSTRHQLKETIEDKEDELEDMQDKLKEFKDDKAELQAEKKTMQNRITDLQEDKEMLEKTLGQTEDLLMKFRHQVEELDQELE